MTKSPYKGPVPYLESDEEILFGRDYETNELVSLIISNPEVVIYAESGTGKSSVINAKIIPALKRKGFNVLPTIRLRGLDDFGLTMRPKNIFSFNALYSLSERNTPVESLLSSSLTSHLSEVTVRSTVPTVMIFDQFEELVTAHLKEWSHRSAFMQELGAAVTANGMLRAVFIIREDYLAKLDGYCSYFPGELSCSYRLSKLGEKEALEAITGPLATVANRVRFADGVAEKIVEELLKVRVDMESSPEATAEYIAGEHVEPVQLQLVCSKLWESMDKDESVITQKHVDDCGNLLEVLSSYYDDAVREIRVGLPSIKEEILRTTIEQNLITPYNTRSTVIRGQYNTGGIANEAFDILAKKNIVRTEWRAGARWYELTHDTFIEPIKISNRVYYLTNSDVNYDVRGNSLISAAAEKTRKSEFEAAQRDYALALECFRISGNRLMVGAIALCQAELFLWRLKKIEEGLKCVENGLMILKELSSADALKLRAVGHSIKGNFTLMHSGQYQESLTEFRTAFELVPNEGKYIAAIGTVFWYMHDFDKAVEYLSKGMDLETDPAELTGIFNNLGQVYAEKGEYEKAIELLDHAIAFADEQERDASIRAFSRNGRGLAYGHLGEFDKSFKDFDDSLRLWPDNSWVYFNRATVHESRGDKASARKDYEKSLQSTNPPLNGPKEEIAKRKVKELS